MFEIKASTALELTLLSHDCYIDSVGYLVLYPELFTYNLRKLKNVIVGGRALVEYF